MKRLILVLSLLLPQGASAQSDPFMDLTMPDFTAPAVEPSADQLDASPKPPTVIKGCEVPARPEWTINFPPQERQKGTLIRLMHERLWLSKVTGSESCSCENRWPEWTETEVAFDLYMKDLSMKDMTLIYQAISRGNDALAMRARELCAEENH